MPNNNKEMISDLRHFLDLTEKMSNDMVKMTNMDEKNVELLKLRQEFSDGCFQKFIDMVEAIDILDDYESGPSDFLLPVVNVAAALCLKIIKHHHPLGACDVCTENVVRVFEHLVHVYDHVQIDPTSTRH